jgi:hypothetical protein
VVGAMRLTKIHVANLAALIFLARAAGVPWRWALSGLWIPLAASGALIIGLIAWSALVVFWIQE